MPRVRHRPVTGDVQEILVSEDAIKARIAELATRIAADYEGKDLVLVGVLKGALMFLVDLARAISLPLELDFMAVSSYSQGARSTGAVQIVKDLDANIEGRDVLIVEDIVDSGLTLNYIREVLQTRNPASLRVCALLDKIKENAHRRKADVALDYLGFQIPDKFVVGYGLDYADLYRNMPFVGVLKPTKKAAARRIQAKMRYHATDQASP